MYTQCPKCQTVFHITMEQLQVHNGLVRCGRCDNFFNADQQLFSDIPGKAPQNPVRSKKTRAPVGVKAKSVKAKTAVATTPVPAVPAKTAEKPETVTEEVEAAPPPWSAPIPERTPRRPDPEPGGDSRNVVLDSSPARPGQQFSFVWILGIVVLAATLAAQSIYFYRDQLAVYPELRPHLTEMCLQLRCRVQPPYDANHIELVQPTNIAPHPRFANALRLRATLVSRANNLQPHPTMQITLTDSGGRVLARRIFSPRQYLEQRASAGTDMPPHLAVSALIDLTNPDGKAVGYQIDFLPPPPS